MEQTIRGSFDIGNKVRQPNESNQTESLLWKAIVYTSIKDYNKKSWSFQQFYTEPLNKSSHE